MDSDCDAYLTDNINVTNLVMKMQKMKKKTAVIDYNLDKTT
jgi:hypothetical protein